MIALEIQGLSERRENLLIEIGRTVIASGFTLQRQRLAQDPHGVLLTMVVLGPPRKKRALSEALDAHERLISYVICDFDEDRQKPHFAASFRLDPNAYVPPPTPVDTLLFGTRRVTDPNIGIPEPFIAPTPEPELPLDLEDDAFFASISVPVSARSHILVAAVASVDQFVELVPIDADDVAVDKLLPKLMNHYPDIFPKLEALQKSVVKEARESSLHLAGQRLGAWVFERDFGTVGKLSLSDAIGHVGVPALRAIVEVEQRGEQLHILSSPACAEGGDSGCQFFHGYLETLLTTATSSDAISIFSVCCRSYGAGECVFALSDG